MSEKKSDGSTAIQWHNIDVPLVSRIKRGPKSSLICLPEDSEYAGYCFWCLNKLSRKSTKPKCINIGFTPDFTFKLMKIDSEGNIDEEAEPVVVTAEQLKNLFN